MSVLALPLHGRTKTPSVPLVLRASSTLPAGMVATTLSSLVAPCGRVGGRLSKDSMRSFSAMRLRLFRLWRTRTPRRPCLYSLDSSSTPRAPRRTKQSCLAHFARNGRNAQLEQVTSTAVFFALRIYSLDLQELPLVFDLRRPEYYERCAPQTRHILQNAPHFRR